MRELNKPKTAEKTIVYEGEKLKRVVLDTVKKASDLVGSTLGPNGRVVLIERSEQLPPMATKDGITVFSSMSFTNSTQQAILEAARDASSRTNTEAGDGTTGCTILAEALIRHGFEYLERNPHASTQRVMRELENAYKEFILSFIQQNSAKITLDNSVDLLKKVAMIATNSDEEMTDAVVKAFDMVGHNGNITITEAPGSSGFDVDKIEGFNVARGFEDTCGRFVEEFINDRGNNRTLLDNPRFLLYNGKVNDIAILFPIIEQLGTAMNESVHEKKKFSPNIVVVAHGFSEQVLATLANNFKRTDTLNIVPLKTPMTSQANSPYHFLVDLQAFTGAELFDPLTRPLQTATLNDLGLHTMRSFEYYRYRSIIFGEPDELRIFSRIDELEKQANDPETLDDAALTRDRMAALGGGIAKVVVLGSSEAELKEKKHRVEDAIAAVRGALKYGVLPGCAKTLVTLSRNIQDSNLPDSVKSIMAPSFMAPFTRLMKNGGHTDEYCDNTLNRMMAEDADFWFTYDALNYEFGPAIDLGVIDSASAVIMAIKNSLAVAKMLMGLSGVVTFKRDRELDQSEAINYYDEQSAIRVAERNDLIDTYRTE
jgi:chaperonin GroEL